MKHSKKTGKISKVDGVYGTIFSIPIENLRQKSRFVHFRSLLFLDFQGKPIEYVPIFSLESQLCDCESGREKRLKDDEKTDLHSFHDLRILYSDFHTKYANYGMMI